MVDELEPLIDRYMEQVDLPPKFVIPGGTTLSAQLDVARDGDPPRRAAGRRPRRRRTGSPREAVLRYLNRASDLAFAMARFADVDDPELFEGRERGAATMVKVDRPPPRRASPTTSRSRAATAW